MSRSNNIYSVVSLLFVLVVGAAWRRDRPPSVQATVREFPLVSGLQDLETAHERLVHGHHGACIVKLAAVVGRREQRDQLSLSKELVTIFDNLRETSVKIKTLKLTNILSFEN